MEDRVKKYRRQKFIIGLVGVIVGSTIYSLLGFEYDRVYSFLVGVLSAIIGNAIHDLYHHFKYPEMKNTQKILDKDERNAMIGGKAAYITINITQFSLIIPITVGIFMENQLLAYFSIALYIFIMLVFFISKRYWSKRI